MPTISAPETSRRARSETSKGRLKWLAEYYLFLPGNLAVIIGISANSRQLLADIRKNDPPATIIACNDSVPGQPLPYLEQGDLLLQGNCQATIPQVYALLRETLSSKIVPDSGAEVEQND